MAKQSPVKVRVTRSSTAPPEVLYDLVSDVTRMPEWSPETIAAEWLGDDCPATPGARFKGTNTLGRQSWSTKPTVTVADRGQTFAFDVPGKSGPTWTYEFTELPDGGTRISESVRQERPSPAIVRFFQRRAGVTDRTASLREGMETTLARLTAVAESSPAI